jgi:formylglycine-generating enzyme required for sulfatase activity
MITARCFIEDLSNLLPEDIQLKMLEIPAGSFLMGAPEEEAESEKDERPQHEVNVPTFWMGKYPITQAQWKAVAEKLPQVKQELNLKPSHFDGNNLPVECVSWLDAIEFCARLSKHTGREYRLPSEAEWEYACRAGTVTPFHFGETITTELVNYDGNLPYGAAPKGENRESTTEVGKFPPNAFGLHDMHGNIWELCEDDWHLNYNRAPVDGRAWIDENKSRYGDGVCKVMRGGSWLYTAGVCRSASRNVTDVCEPMNYLMSNGIGFRVVCGLW